MRYEIREAVAWLRELLRRACIWKWEVDRFALRDDRSFDILFVGRRACLEDAKLVLGVEDNNNAVQADVERSRQTVYAGEFPIPGSLHVPRNLRNILPLGRPIEVILAEYDKYVRKTLRNRTLYRMQRVLDEVEVERVDREMLRPYAIARHGKSALQFNSDKVRSMALEYGRLEIFLSGDEVVGCAIGYQYMCAGKRYWLAERMGYPENVFSDQKRLSEVNSIFHHLIINWAIDQGFDYCDFGVDFARPDSGLFHFKRRRGTVLSTTGLKGSGLFHVRLPSVDTAQFLWDAPLFAIEHHKLTLHLGLPKGPSDEEVTIRYREMNFEGLSKVYLHCAMPPGEMLLNKLHNLYRHQKSPPVVEIISTT
jgi:hypothetical protein